MSRKDCLNALISLDKSLDEILSELNMHGCDSDVAIATIYRQHILQILNRYLKGDLTAEEVERLADSLHVCEDVGCERGFEELLREAFFESGAAFLTQPICADTAKLWIDRISQIVE